MPEISRFLGILVFMLYDDHHPPHFHARYVEFEVSVEIETGLVTGSFPRRALMLLMEWYALHKEELLMDWKLAREHRPLKGIAPLE
jgi:Domain of unknown function (DUF4160)